MLEQPDSPTASQTKQQVFDHYLYRLQSEIHTIISSESEYEERVKSLENDLAVFKRACFTSEAEKRHLLEDINTLREKLETLELQTKQSQQNLEKRIVCLIDGDGTIFSVDLMTKGQEGGRLAAKLLTESVHYHLPADAHTCHLWTYVFFNKRGLMDTFARAGGELREARDAFENFMLGFNQSCERFVMVDVGGGKEAADAKIKVHLDSHARSPETYKIIFGGCHDNGYVPQLQSLVTSIHREKLILLPGYDEMASEINKLQLPSLIIPGLFLPNKIVIGTHSRQNSFSVKSVPTAGGSSSLSTLSLGPPPGLPPPAASTSEDEPVDPPSGTSTPPPPPPYPQAEPTSSVISEPAQVKPEASRLSDTSSTRSSSPERAQRVVLGHASGPVSYRNAVQAWQFQPAEPFIEQNGSGNNVMKGISKQRRINHSIHLSQHDPPPCTLFYLATNGCKHGAECRFGHDYILDDDDYELLRQNAKKVPCPAANRGEVCIFGDSCCYGHICPFLTRCHYFKQGKCKFAGANMHRES